MNRKNLPKTIRRASGSRAVLSAFNNAEEISATPPVKVRAEEEHRARSKDSEATVIELVLPGETTLARTNELQARVEPTSSDGEALQRELRARAIVERYVAYSAVGGAIPLPIVNLASITTTIVRMVKVLSDLYNVPFERSRARAIVTGLMGGAASSGVTLIANSFFAYLVPGGALVGIAASSIAAAACTRSVGKTFVSHFETGATLGDFPQVKSH